MNTSTKPRGPWSSRALTSLLLCLLLALQCLTPAFASGSSPRFMYLLTAVLGEDGQTLYSYDENGLLLSSQDRGVSSLTVNAKGQVTSFRDAKGLWTLTWNAGGHVSSVKCADVTLSYRYDAQGGLIKVLRKSQGKTTSIDYENTYQGGLLRSRRDLSTGGMTRFEYHYLPVSEENLSFANAQQELLLNHRDLPLGGALIREDTKAVVTTTSAKAKALAAPTSLTAALTSSNGVKLSWKAVSGATKYIVYKKAKGDKSYTKVTTVKKNTATIKASALKTGETYSFYVVAQNSSGKSKKSATTSITTLGAIKKAKAQVSSGTALVTWKKDSLATAYEVALTSSKKASGIKASEITESLENHHEIKESLSGHYLFVRSVRAADGVRAHGPWTKVSVKEEKPTPVTTPTPAKATVTVSFARSDKKTLTSLDATYSDGFFTESSKKENKDLAFLSGLGNAAMQGINKGADFLKSLGFEVPKGTLFSADGTTTSKSSLEDNDHAMVQYGFKTLGEGSDQTLVAAVLILGYSENAYEWISNFNLGIGETAAGFEKAATEVYELTKREVEDYLKKNSLTCPVKYWVTGYSRGAAVANLVGASLTADHGEEAVYAYTFATPEVSKTVKAYENIHNYVINEDFVPRLAPANWGFRRNGKDTVFTVTTSGVAEAYKQVDGKEATFFVVNQTEGLIKAFEAMGGGSQDNYYKNRGDAAAPVIPADFCMNGIGLARNDRMDMMLKGLETMDTLSRRDKDCQALYSLLMQYTMGGQFLATHSIQTYLATLMTR